MGWDWWKTVSNLPLDMLECWKPPPAFLVVHPKSQMRIFAFPQVTKAAVSHYTRMNMAQRDPQKTLCFFILPVLGGFKHLIERLQLVNAMDVLFFQICFNSKYCKSSQKLLMAQQQVSNPSCVFFVGNFNIMEFLECENHPVELLMHEAWLSQALHQPHLSLS